MDTDANATHLSCVAAFLKQHFMCGIIGKAQRYCDRHKMVQSKPHTLSILVDPADSRSMKRLPFQVHMLNQSIEVDLDGFRMHSLCFFDDLTCEFATNNPQVDRIFLPLRMQACRP